MQLLGTTGCQLAIEKGADLRRADIEPLGQGSRAVTVLVLFSDPDERVRAAPSPEDAETVTWMDIRRQAVGEAALALAKRPRERLILLLAIYMHMGPSEINALHLAQVTRKVGRDGLARVSLLRDVERTLKRLPVVSKEPAPPFFWITDIQYERVQGQ